jgi:hypothetical protein
MKASIVATMCRIQDSSHHFQFCARGLRIDARAKPGDHPEPVTLAMLGDWSIAGLDLVDHRKRHPEFRNDSDIGAAKVARGHTDDRGASPIDRDRSADNARIAAEPTLPQPMTQHHDRRGPSHVVTNRIEASSERERRLRDRKIVGRGQRPPVPLRITADTEGGGHQRVKCRHPGKRACLTDIEKIQIGQLVSGLSRASIEL